MKSDLGNFSLYNLLKENGAQEAIGKVRSINLYKETGEMELIGFIPYKHCNLRQFDYGLKINLNGYLYVAPNLVQFSKDTPVYPFFKRISSAKDKKYKVERNIFIYSLFDKIPSHLLQNTKFKYPYDGEQLKKILSTSNKYGNLSGLLKFDEDEKGLCYTGNEDDCEFSCGIENMTAISDDFLCLCAYINKVTGTISYVVFHSKEVVRVFSENDNER